MPKDLLSIIQQDKNTHPLVNPNEGDFEMPQDNPELNAFFSQVASIREKTDKLQSCISQVRTKQNELISAPRQDIQTKKELDELANEIRRLASEVRVQVKQIGLETQQMEARDPADPNIQIRQMQLDNISTHLINAMNNYNQAQIEHRDACKAQLKRKMEIAEIPVTDGELDEMLESDNAQVFTQFSLRDTQQARQNLADIEAQRDDIKKLEEDILALQDVMETLNMTINQQGEMVNRIDVNVENTKDYVVQAQQATNKAVVYQKRANKKKWIIIGVVVGIVVLLIIILVASLAK